MMPGAVGVQLSEWYVQIFTKSVLKHRRTRMLSQVSSAHSSNAIMALHLGKAFNKLVCTIRLYLVV
jgi:hypothetical protein